MSNKIVWLILSCLIALILVVASCGAAVENGEGVVTPTGEEEGVVEEAGEEEEAAPPAEEEEVTPLPEEEEEEAPPPSKPHFTSDDGRIEFALDNVERTKVWPAELRVAGLEGSMPKKGHDFIIVDATIVRITDGHLDSGTGSTLIDDKGGEYRGYGGMQGQWTTAGIVPYDRFELLEGSKGKFIYEVPENVEPVKLRLAYLFFKSWSESGQHESEEERYIDIILP